MKDLHGDELFLPENAEDPEGSLVSFACRKGNICTCSRTLQHPQRKEERSVIKILYIAARQHRVR